MNDIIRSDFRNRIHMSVEFSGTVYLTGQVGTAGRIAADQMVEVLNKVDTLLAKAGSDKTRILHATLVLADIRDYDAVNNIWDHWVAKEHAPARSTVEGRLAGKGLLVELIVVAAK